MATQNAVIVEIAMMENVTVMKDMVRMIALLVHQVLRVP